jgi:hypothetical protein
MAFATIQHFMVASVMTPNSYGMWSFLDSLRSVFKSSLFFAVYFFPPSKG